MRHPVLSHPSSQSHSHTHPYVLNITPLTPVHYYHASSNYVGPIILNLISTCTHKLKCPQSFQTCSKAPTPVGWPSRTAPLLPTQLFSTASNPQRSTAALHVLHALLEELMLYFTIQRTKRDAMDSGRVRDVSRIMQASLERGRRLSQGS